MARDTIRIALWTKDVYGNDVKLKRRGQAGIGNDRRDALLAFACEYIREHGVTPSNEECMKAVRISKANLYHHLSILAENGAIVARTVSGQRWNRAWTLPQAAELLKWL